MTWPVSTYVKPTSAVAIFWGSYFEGGLTWAVLNDAVDIGMTPVNLVNKAGFTVQPSSDTVEYVLQVSIQFPSIRVDNFKVTGACKSAILARWFRDQS